MASDRVDSEGRPLKLITMHTDEELDDVIDKVVLRCGDRSVEVCAEHRRRRLRRQVPHGERLAALMSALHEE